MIIELSKPDDPENVPAEWYEGRMRTHRNRLLTQSDWAMTSDAPTDKQAWTNYRQALRDFPATWTPGNTADFPEAPK